MFYKFFIMFGINVSGNQTYYCDFYKYNYKYKLKIPSNNV